MRAVILLRPRRHGDNRGWFSEVYSERAFAEQGIDDVFVQDNHSYSSAAGTIRGLHFQLPPHGQAKLIRCVRGSIWDIVVDIRANSPTFGHHVGAELSAENGLQLYVPVGFAHGFITLEPGTEILYKVSSFYAPESDGGIAWDDEDLAIDWRMPESELTFSPRDTKWPRLREFKSPFPYKGTPLTPLGTNEFYKALVQRPAALSGAHES